MRTMLYSGGLDSQLLSKLHKADNYVYLDYGQHPVEELAAINSCPSTLTCLQLAFRLDCSKEVPYRNISMIFRALMEFPQTTQVIMALHRIENEPYYNDTSPKFVQATNRYLEHSGHCVLVTPFIDLTLESMLKLIPESFIKPFVCCNEPSRHTINCDTCKKCTNVQAALVSVGYLEVLERNFNERV